MNQHKTEEEQRKAALGAWALQHGTDSQRERFKRGKLADEEMLRGLREYTFRPLVPLHLEPFKRIRAHEVCECEDRQHEFDVQDHETASESQWPLARAILGSFPDNTLPDVVVVFRRHHGGCLNCHQEVVRWSCSVRVEMDGWRFSREFAAPAPEEVEESE